MTANGIRLVACLTVAALGTACQDAAQLARATNGSPETAVARAAATTKTPAAEPTVPVSGETAVSAAASVEPALDSAKTVAARADTMSRRKPPTSVADRDFSSARFQRPEHVRGLYVNASGAGSNGRMSELVDIARDTEVNAFVIDIKDATGYLSHRSEVPLAQEIGANGERRIADLPGLLDRLEAEGIYPIARIVIVKDPLLAARHPEYAIQDTAGGVWIDSKGIVWMNPFSEQVWKYHVDIAREVAEMGFPEIQWDYVRFPDAPKSDLDRAVYLNRNGRSRPEAIRAFLDHSRAALADIPAWSTADVFGITTTYFKDVGTGQVWEDVIDVVDVALPMIYPSHYYTGSFGYKEPNGRPYEVIRDALEDALDRSASIEGAGTTRPWLQDFTLGQPVYAGAEVRAQIQATYDAGVQEWILWNPGSRYTVTALEPNGGFEHEPLVRVAGVLAPVSRRMEVIDSVSTARAQERLVASGAVIDTEPTARLDPVTAPALAAPASRTDSIRVVVPRIPRPDSVRSLPAPADTIR